MVQATPTHVIAHISDTHLLAGGAPLHGVVDTVRGLTRALQRLEESGHRIDAIVHTGDIADLGEPDAYRRVRELVEPAAERLGCPVVWIAGNHDVRGPLRRELLDAAPSDEPVTSSVTVRGLRIIGLDTSVPGAGHGHLGAGQLEWLRGELAVPAEHGTVIAMHHPPLPTQVKLLEGFQLDDPDDLAPVIAGSDVRAVLAGHFHYAVSGTVAGVPLAVAPATSYTIRLDAAGRGLSDLDAEQGIGLLTVYPHAVAHAVSPITPHLPVLTLPDDHFTRAEA